MLCCGCILYASAFSSQKDTKKVSKEDTEKKVNNTVTLLLEVMDRDKDGRVNEEEMTAWVRKTLRKTYKEDSGQIMSELDTDKDDKLSFEELLKSEEDIGVATEEKKRKRFKVADADKDGLLNTDEVTSMFHPEERPHMFEVIIDEYMEVGDINGDGLLSLEEYKEKMFKGTKENLEAADKFYGDQDKNGDGSFDREEIKEWLRSISTSSLAKRQTKQVLERADENKDGAITDSEILKNIDLFTSVREVLENEKRKAEEAEKAEKNEKAKVEL